MTMKHLPLGQFDQNGIRIDGESDLKKVTTWCGELVPPADVFTYDQARKVKPMTYEDMVASGFKLSEIDTYVLPEGKNPPCLDCVTARTEAEGEVRWYHGPMAAVIHGVIMGLTIFIADAVVAWFTDRPRMWTLFWHWLTS